MNGFVKALVVGTVANRFEKVGFEVLGGDDFETVANGSYRHWLLEPSRMGTKRLGLWLLTTASSNR